MVVKFLISIVRGLLKLRYRVTVKGLENLASPREGGILFLPNHPAEIDPVLLFSVLGSRFPLHPLVVERFYYMEGLDFLFRRIRAVPIPDFNGVVNLWKQKKVDKALSEVGKQLQAGEHFLIYPSGRLKHEAEEVVGGASMVHSLVQQFPQVNIVLVRTTGFWGSRFSRALTGAVPDFRKTVRECLKIVLKNCIFFVPKRDVLIEMELAPPDFPRDAPRPQFNQYLEKWYNTPSVEPLKLVSEKFWKESLPVVRVEATKKEETSWTVSPAVEKEIFEKIRQLAKQSDIDRAHYLERDLRLDSLDIAQLGLFLEGRYELGEIPPGKLQTVEDALRVVALQDKSSEASLSRKTWPVEPHRLPVLPPQGETLQECFLATCRRMGSHVACADQLLGILTYPQLKKLVFILSRRLRSFEENRIGILLPSSTMTYLFVFATLLAGKTPVMLNWTLGSRALDHCRSLAGLKTILSSRRFLDNLNNVDLGDIEDSLVLLEDLKRSLSWMDKLGGLFDLLKSDRSVLKRAGKNETAVILFTSGTEALPKGVPLSHQNLLSNHRAAIESIDITPTDVFYGVLPPFHSFGFSVTGILPLLAGLKVYYAPDPTQYHAMAHDIQQWKVTFFCSAPTFILGVFRVAKAGECQVLRYIVAGAETTPTDLFELIKTQGKELLEGYGITECSPVVTLTRPGHPRQGVGQPLPGIELCTIDPETKRPLPRGEEGEICIRGPNVFSGYLNLPKNPFIEIQGQQWYLSGDRGYLTPEGSLILSGRLKRFVKIGGEMISLGGLEEDLLRLASEKQWIKTAPVAPSLAVIAEEDDGAKPQLILFTTFPLKKEDVNQALLEKRCGRLAKISKVYQIEQIPVTGTGKIQYSSLHEII